jgi:Zinc carboxypeptidase
MITTKPKIASRVLLLLCVAAISSPLAAGLTGADSGRHRVHGTRAASRVPSPRDVLGFTPGDDRELASWERIVDYFKALARASDRVILRDLGQTTLGRPFLLAIISSPANLARLDQFREIQRKLADPRAVRDQEEAEKLIAQGRSVVLITCGVHSTEVGGNLVSMNIAFRLASDDSPDTRDILDKCIVLLVPSLNPDGVDIVKNWYDKTLGTPAEGTGPPEIYHHYTGHDNNRDWYAFTQVETQLAIDKVHNIWHPQIVHDIHQQGETGSRFFIPPYVDPWEPNVPPLIQAGVNFMGSCMAWDLVAEGKAGIVINGVYDAWTPARAYQHYHAGIRILSETASARLATPTSVAFDKLTPQVNVDTKTRSWNFPVVWSGGEWRLSDIVGYMESGAFALMRNAARYRERWVRNFYLIGRDAVRGTSPGSPFAFLILPPHATGDIVAVQKEGLARIESILRRGGVEIAIAEAPFDVGGARYPGGTRIVPMAQPYGAFAKTLLERQMYPDLREYKDGPPRRPYDVTAHTLPLLMGVEAIRVDKPFAIPVRARVGVPDDRAVWSVGSRTGGSRIGLYKSYAASMDEGWTRWIFDRYGVKYSSVTDGEIREGKLRGKFDCIIIPDQSPRQILEGLSSKQYPAELAGGLGAAGVESLKQFVEDGGTLVTLNSASDFAIEKLDLPVRNVLKDISTREFFCPGSILRIEYDASNSLTAGAPPLGSSTDESIAWFERGPAFEATGPGARIVARFSDAKDVLLSGWLLGAERIAGKGAIVEAKKGSGRVVMFAFRPQYRGQSVATLPLFFNAIR